PVDGEHDAAEDEAALGRGQGQHRAEDGPGADSGDPARGAEEEGLRPSRRLRGALPGGIGSRQHPGRVEAEAEELDDAEDDEDERGDEDDRAAVGGEQGTERTGTHAEGDEHEQHAHIEDEAMEDQARARPDGGAEERRQQECGAGAEQSEDPPDEGADQADVHQFCPFFAVSTASTKTSVGWAPTYGCPSRMNVGVENAPRSVPMAALSATASAVSSEFMSVVNCSVSSPMSSATAVRASGVSSSGERGLPSENRALWNSQCLS